MKKKKWVWLNCCWTNVIWHVTILGPLGFHFKILNSYKFYRKQFFYLCCRAFPLLWLQQKRQLVPFFEFPLKMGFVCEMIRDWKIWNGRHDNIFATSQFTKISKKYYHRVKRQIKSVKKEEKNKLIIVVSLKYEMTLKLDTNHEIVSSR